MERTLAAALLRSLRSVFDTLFQMDVQTGACERRRIGRDDDAVRAVVSISGSSLQAEAALVLPCDTARRIVSLFTADEAAADSCEMIHDAAAELLTLIVDGAASHLRTGAFSVGLPRIESDSPEPHAQPGGFDLPRETVDHTWISLPCSCDLGDFLIEACVRDDVQASAVPDMPCASCFG